MAESLKKMNLDEFFKNIHKQFYSTIDITFMEYFLEIVEREGEFIIPHSKLLDYGIMTSGQSCHVVEKLNTLGLVKNEDYILTDVRENKKSGPGAPSKNYMFTPDAFKMCLMRAQRRPGQSDDPVKYVVYYLLLEKMFKLYKDYQTAYQNKLISIKDDKIDQQSKKIDEQSAKIDRLLGYAEETTVKLDETNNKLDEVQNDLTETKEEVVIVKNHLIEKSLVSTKNPNSESLHHHFSATTVTMIDGVKIIKFTTGTKSYVDKAVAKLVNDRNHEVIIPAFYNANGFDLRQNCRVKFMQFRRQRISEINTKNAQADKDFNDSLRAEILAYNRSHSGNKRSYKSEQRKTVKVMVKDIQVEFNILSVKYHNNPYISFEEVIDIVKQMNNETQASPVSDE